MEWINNLIGFGLGVLASWIVWFVVSRCIVPRIEFSKYLSRTQPNYQDNPLYRFRLRNKGRRQIIDIDIFFRIRIKGINPRFPDTWEIIRIPLGNPYGHIPFLSTHKKAHGGIMTISIEVNNCEKFSRPFMPEEIREKYKKKILTLDDVFSITNTVEGELIAYGYDEFSGARKMFRSKKYTKADILDGVFEYRGMKIETNFQATEIKEATMIEVDL